MIWTHATLTPLLEQTTKQGLGWSYCIINPIAMGAQAHVPSIAIGTSLLRWVCRLLTRVWFQHGRKQACISIGGEDTGPCKTSAYLAFAGRLHFSHGDKSPNQGAVHQSCHDISTTFIENDALSG